LCSWSQIISYFWGRLIKVIIWAGVFLSCEEDNNMYLAIKSFCNIKEGAKKVIDNDLETIYLIGLLTGSMIRKWYLREFSRKEQMNAIKGPDGPLLILSAIAMFILPITYIFTQKLDFANYNL
jgi:hypothetical protein